MKVFNKIIGSNRLRRIKIKLYHHGMRPKSNSIWFDKRLNKLYDNADYGKKIHNILGWAVKRKEK